MHPKPSVPPLVRPPRSLAQAPTATTLAQYLVGGIIKADLHPGRVHSLRWTMLRRDDFVLAPLPQPPVPPEEHVNRRRQTEWHSKFARLL
ncbi:MAG: hypothetical protein M3083_20375 [Actinomycetota bacterium]|nr:hypothetical protein [Actinomycetota bacterium]MDQ6945009.1 hypothetical protein [Actinomycetota bacterium]